MLQSKYVIRKHDYFVIPPAKYESYYESCKIIENNANRVNTSY